MEELLLDLEKEIRGFAEQMRVNNFLAQEVLVKNIINIVNKHIKDNYEVKKNSD